MPVKILLADKSITIQKVVEMLFSGKEYEVLCVSDGETALNEATRIVPDVVLADIDLPRVDGYTFSGRLKQQPSLAKTPVILMMSRDDVFDEAKARQAAIFDHIAKPFESQELIGKVKKAVSAAPPRLAEPAARPAPAKPQTAAAPAASAGAAKAKPKQAPPSDIFDIIQQAPTQADLKGGPAGQAADEGIFEVEPVVEVEEAAAPGASRALPVGKRAVEEMREGLGLAGKGQPDQDIVSFESLDMAVKNEQEFMPVRREEPRPRTAQKPERAPEGEAREYVPPPRETGAPAAAGVPEERLRKIAEEIVARVAREQFGAGRPSAQISEDSVARTVKEIARDVIEKVAWEVVPDLAEMLIRQEIERLKAET